MFETENIEKAKERARDEAYYIKRDKRKNDYVEIQEYESGIEDENGSINFDYDTIEF